MPIENNKALPPCFHALRQDATVAFPLYWAGPRCNQKRTESEICRKKLKVLKKIKMCKKFKTIADVNVVPKAQTHIYGNPPPKKKQKKKPGIIIGK